MKSAPLWAGDVAVVGLGYIGLPTSAALAAKGIRVKGVDVNSETVAAISAGLVPIVEPDLDSVVAQAVLGGALTASTEMPEADAFMIAVPTPSRGENLPDLSYVEAATKAIAPKLRGGEIVILESTSPPGTTLKISQWLAESRPDLKFPHDFPSDPDINVAHCPERVLPGRIMIEIAENDRVVGGITPSCADRAAAIYRVFCTGEIFLTDAQSAEMAKLVENSFRDVNIAFANELARVCEYLELDVWEIISLANRHPRVNILKPGPGVGGHCIAVDPWFIVSAAPDQSQMIRLARETNDSRPEEVVAKIVLLADRAPGPIALLGLAFKANIDDLRESPAIEIVQNLANGHPHRRFLVVEPHISSLPRSLAGLPNVELTDLETAIGNAGVVALLVDHQQFGEVSRAALAEKSILDTRGMWRDRIEVSTAGN